jgi:hypothetical protein
MQAVWQNNLSNFYNDTFVGNSIANTVRNLFYVLITDPDTAPQHAISLLYRDAIFIALSAALHVEEFGN